MTRRAAPSLSPPWAQWRSVVRDLDPGVFAFVMATGIVSVALTPAPVSDVLLLIALAGYLGLVVVSGWRLLRWPRRMLADALGPRGFGVLTFVAASNVLAARLAAGDFRWPAVVLFLVGVLAWLVLGYGVPLGLIGDTHRHPSLEQVNGTWFLWVVGTQSVAVAAASLAPFGQAMVVTVVGLVCWAIGLVLYLLLAGIGLARMLVRPVSPRDLVAPDWVFMGAAAITILAGARLLTLPAATHLVSRDVLTGALLTLWSFCTWLIPMLLALGVWRYVRHLVSLSYDSGLWAVVFPVGMYGVATTQLGKVTDTAWLAALGDYAKWVGLALWIIVFAGMLLAAGRFTGTRWVRAGKHA
ncbi:hypothetical protein GKO32_04085 [Amycolatopsis sp. RM579]|uniref:Tellurite resistance protein permease n=2 Tax=Amycolatopsis pithecellobii TaxID=664692 RepID=A0A6N7Z0N4_9PSEU|nr:hypothetical protein [Amycolatopsis pithecellobii]